MNGMNSENRTFQSFRVLIANRALKGLSDEIDFKNFDKNLQNLT
jgi:hypothetical protein